MERPRKSKKDESDDDDAGAQPLDHDKQSLKSEQKTEAKKPTKAAPTGYNWPAVIILAMFALAPIIGGGIQLYDYLNPAGAAKMEKARAVEIFKGKLEGCYKVAAPEKLKNVGKLASNIFRPSDERFSVHQARSKERVFWAKMLELYGKHEECDH